MSNNKVVSFVIKRLFDIVVSSLTLIVLSPVLLLVAILIRTKLGSPILFKQDRVGKNNKIFKMVKFRTMKNAVDNKGNLLPEEQRRTEFGNKLRDLSLDELPELINIIKGDMSIVGPRPLLVEYIPFYNDEQKHRHDVLPGLTGWAQINGRNSITWAEKFKLDVWYVENWNCRLDLKIVFKTFLKVVKKDGIDQNGEVSMEKFDGTN